MVNGARKSASKRSRLDVTYNLDLTDKQAHIEDPSGALRVPPILLFPTEK